MLTMYVYDTSLQCVGIIDSAKSTLWVRKLFSPNTVEIELPLNELYLDIIQQYYTIVRNDTQEAVLIRTIAIQDSIETGRAIKVTAYDYSTMFYRRSFSQTGANVYAAISNNTQGNKVIPNLTLHTDLQNITIAKQHAMLGDSLELSMQVDMTWGLQSVMVDGGIQLQKITCTDRSTAQSINPQVIFAQKYDNFLSMNYTISDENAVNTVVCSINTDGADDPNNVPTDVGIESNKSGFERHEIHVEINASIEHVSETIPIYSSTGVKVDEVTIDHKYVDVAKTRENANSSCNNRIQQAEPTVEGIIVPIGYRTDWDVGDTISIISQMGITIDTQITEITEYYDFTSNKIVPTFGSQKLTINDKLRKMGVV